MMVRFSTTRLITLLFLTACSPAGSTPAAIGTTETSMPPAATAESTGTPDLQILIEAATLLSVDFENGYPI